jgi:hypothetical protein
MRVSLKKVSQEQLELVKKFEYLRDTFRLRCYERIIMFFMLFWLKHLALGESNLVYAKAMYDDVWEQAKKRGRRNK